MDSDMIKEVIEYKERRIVVIFLFLFLLLIPFAFAIESYLALKGCQGKESNGCSTLSLPPVGNTAYDTVLNGNSQQLHTDYTKNEDKQEII